MSTLTVAQLTKSYGAELIFRGVSFRVDGRDRIGLVGPNGAGKTTLLELLAGRLERDGGDIAYASGTSVGYLPQVVDFHPERTLYEEMLAVFAHVHTWEAELSHLATQMGDPQVLADEAAYTRVLDRYAELQAKFEHAGGYTLEQRARQVLDGLGFTPEEQAAPARQLSGGQQTRASLGKLLLQEPEMLLLDEPTNHLDLAALEWLENYLTSWHGSVIVVSHDRYFLDRVTTRTIEIANQRAELYPGNYSKYLELRGERLERWTREYVEQQEHIAHTEEFIRKYKAGQRAKEARGRQTLLDRLERIERPPEDTAIAFRMHAEVESGGIVLTTDHLIAGYPPRSTTTAPIVADDAGAHPGTRAGLRVRMADVQVPRGERIGLIGPNGGGKTTLLRTLIGQLSPLEGRASLGHNVQFGYYAQTHDELNPRLSVLDEVRLGSPLSEEGARTYLGRFLFSGDDVFKAIGSLSGGERSRVALAKLTLQGANFLILDEPTNHLDLPSRQVLESVLSTYDGTLLFVSHDRYFVDALATTLWVLDDGAITVQRGNYSTFRTRRQQGESAAQAPSARANPTTQRKGQERPAQPGTQPSVRAIERIEAEITRLEQRLLAIEAELNEAGQAADVERLTALGEEYETTRARLDTLYIEWQEQAS